MKRTPTLITLRHAVGGVLLTSVVLLAATLAGCSKENAPGDTTPDGEIRITALIDDGPGTRAFANKATGLTGVSFVVKHGASAPASWTDGEVYTGNVAGNTGLVTFGNAPIYKGYTDHAYLVAYHPGKALTSGAVEWDIDGKTDIMVTNAVWDAGIYTAPLTTGLRFSHCLSRIEVVLKAESGAHADAVRSAWGNIQKIEFINAPSKMKCDLTGGIPAITQHTAVNRALLKTYDGATFTAMVIPDNNNTAVNAVAMLAPVAPTATESFKLRVTSTGYKGTPIVADIPVHLDGGATAMTAGHTHTVMINFKANGRQVEVSTSTVDDWLTGTTASGDWEVP